MQQGVDPWSAMGAGPSGVIVNTLVLDSAGVTLYAGTDAGVFASPTGGAVAWTVYGTGLPHVQVLDLSLQTYGNHAYLAAATHGRGIWIIDPPVPATAVQPPILSGPMPRGTMQIIETLAKLVQSLLLPVRVK